MVIKNNFKQLGIGIFIGAILALAIFGAYTLGCFNFVPIVIDEDELSSAEMKIIDVCKKSNLEASMSCLVNQVSSFYYYNKTNHEAAPGPKIDFARLYKEGGVCRHYAYHYEKWAREMGYTAEHLHIDYGDMYHGSSIIIDEENDDYCLVDQLTVDCVDSKSIEEIEDE